MLDDDKRTTNSEDRATQLSFANTDQTGHTGQVCSASSASSTKQKAPNTRPPLSLTCEEVTLPCISHQH